MKQTDFQTLLRRYQQGECTAQEARQVEAWYEAMHQGEPPALPPAAQERLRASLWRRIEAKARLSPAQPVAKVVRWWANTTMRWSIAALLVLGLSVGTFFLRQAQTHWATRTNTTGQALRLTLPDGTRVALQPGSTLRYPRQFGGPRRETYLTGEAFFDVFHNPAQPFQVYTEQVVTTVLGTSFTVRAGQGQAGTVVQVRRGKVRVSARTAAAPTFANTEANPTSVVLLPNQQAEYSGRAHQLHKSLVDRPVLLAANPQLFSNQPVAAVLNTLGAAYGVTIAYDPALLKRCTVNLAFTDENLYQRLDILCKALDTSYERTESQIVFHSKGCAD
jgi:ferric-dicitrate binding protein FerR (iron transport regulator)